MILFNRGYRLAAPCSYKALKEAGFTLIELMIVCAIIAILAAIAYPSYTSYVAKTNRKAAEACLSEYSNYMERYYTTNLAYNQSGPASGSTAAPTPIALPALDCASTGQTGTNYQYNFATGQPTTSTYQLQAAPQGTQAARDAQCGTLYVDNTGARTISGADTVQQCW